MDWRSRRCAIGSKGGGSKVGGSKGGGSKGGVSRSAAQVLLDLIDNDPRTIRRLLAEG